jgi:hypothetical protein
MQKYQSSKAISIAVSP